MCVSSCFSHVQFFASLWTVAHQALLSMGFSRQEYWSALPCPSPWDLLNPGFKPACSISVSCIGRPVGSLPLAPPRVNKLYRLLMEAQYNQLKSLSPFII